MLKEKPHASRGAWGRFFNAFVFLAVGSTGCIYLGTPQWSPDGRKIVYARAGPGDPEVRLVDLDTSGPPKLIAATAYRPRWSPDGDRIYFLHDNGDLRSCGPDGSDRREIASNVSWYEPSPDGERIYYVSDPGDALVELALAKGRAEQVTPQGVKCTGSALGPGGELLAYAAPKEKRGRRGYEIRLVDLEEGDRERVLAEFVPAARGKGEVGDVLVFFRPQAAELVVFQHEGAERIRVIPLAGGRSRTIKVDKLRTVVVSSISPEGAYLYLTEADESSASSRLVDLETGEVEMLLKDSPVLVGGLGWAPGGGAVAEHTPGGLLVREVHGAWERYYPVGEDEYLVAARTRMRQGRSEEALAILEEALEPGESGMDLQRLGLVAVDAHLHLGERTEAADRLLEAWLLHPISESDHATAVRLFGALRGDDRLADAIYRALKEKEPSGRVKALAEAIVFTDDAGLLAGIQFRLGEAEFAARNYTEAGKRFRLASEAEGFPAADYAAALAAGAHFVSGRNDSYAEELLLKAIDCFAASPLQDDFRSALSFLRRNEPGVIRRTPETSHESGATGWVIARSVRSMHWSSGGREAAGAQFVSRRFALEADERTTLWVARPDRPAKKVLTGVRRRLGMLRFSPSGDRLALVASDPAATGGGGRGGFEGSDAVYVIDLDGNILLGDRRLLEGKPLTGGSRIISCAWDRTGRFLTVRDFAKGPDGRPRHRERRISVARAAPPPR